MEAMPLSFRVRQDPEASSGRISVACLGCLLSCQSNRATSVPRQIPKLSLACPIRCRERRLRQGRSDQWGAGIIESLKQGEGGTGEEGEAVAPRDLHVHSHTHRSQYTLFHCTRPGRLLRLRGESSPPPPNPCLRSSVCVCKLVQGCVSQPLRAQTSGWVCAL